MAARIEETDGTQETAREARGTAVVRRRGRLQVFLALACAVGVFAGVRVSQNKKNHDSAPLTEQTLAGTWELKSINGDLVGPNVQSVILLQRVTLQNGLICGETRLRADTEAAVSSMPFPDESVTSVKTSMDGFDVAVQWNGTYTILSSHLVELKLGHAAYRVAIKPDPRTHALDFDHDVVLVYKGIAHYVPATTPIQTLTALR